MKLIRILALVLSLCLTVTVFSACSLFGKASLPAELDAEGRFIYTVIRASQPTDNADTAAKTIRNLMRENFDCKVNISKDGAVEAVEGSYELLIGDTNRPESAEALQALIATRPNTSYDFIVKVINNKVCIQVTNDDMMPIASAWFMETFCEDLNSWTQLTEDYEFIYSAKLGDVDNKVGGVDLGTFTIVKPLFGQYIALMEIEEYISFYEDHGYTINYVEDVDPETTYEILLGDADREASKSVTVEGDNYVIKVVGTKIVIKGGTALATFRAIRHFNELVTAQQNGGEAINWTDGYVINGKYDANEAGTYTLNWADEFDGPSVDLSIWGCYANGTPATSVLGGKCWDYGPGLDFASSGFEGDLPGRMSYITDGKLAFEHYRVGDDFIGESFTTKEALRWKYGVAEIEIQVPSAPSTTSLWFNGQPATMNMGDGEKLSTGNSCFTEIDLIENYGKPNEFSANVHRWWTELTADGLSHSNAHNIALEQSYLDDDSDTHYVMDLEKYGEENAGDKAVHNYSWYWDENQMKFAFDGKRWCTYDYTTANSISVHALMTYFIIGGGMGDSSYGTTWKENLHPDYNIGYIDACRVYQTDAFNSQMVIGYTTDEYERKAVIVYPDNPIVNSY